MSAQEARSVPPLAHNERALLVIISDLCERRLRHSVLDESLLRAHMRCRNTKDSAAALAGLQAKGVIERRPMRLIRMLGEATETTVAEQIWEDPVDVVWVTERGLAIAATITGD